MADKAVAIGSYTAEGVFEHEVWELGDTLTDPDGNSITAAMASGYADFTDDPDNWEKIPYTKFEAVQDIAWTFARHIGRTLSGGEATGIGIAFEDKTEHVWATVPSFLIDAIQVLSFEISSHFGAIPCPGTGASDAPYTDNVAYWSNVPKTYLEAIQCIAAFVRYQLNMEIPCRTQPHDYIDDPSKWVEVPFTKVHAVRTLAAELAIHLGYPIPYTASLDSGVPYIDTPSLWSPSVPPTVDEAIRAIAAELVVHVGGVITCNVYPNVAYRDTWRFTDNPSNWTNVPTSAMQAIECIATELSTHLGFPLATLGSAFLPGGDGEYVSPPVSASSVGVRGQWSFDGTYIYKCVATDTWVRFIVITSF